MPRLVSFFLPTGDGECVRGTRRPRLPDGARMTCGCPRCAPWFWCRVCRHFGRPVPNLIADQDPCWTLGLCLEHLGATPSADHEAKVLTLPVREE